MENTLNPSQTARAKHIDAWGSLPLLVQANDAALREDLETAAMLEAANEKKTAQYKRELSGYSQEILDSALLNAGQSFAWFWHEGFAEYWRAVLDSAECLACCE
jgi:hypothetical protein